MIRAQNPPPAQAGQKADALQITLVSHTHWDRAWYCTFQEYRVRLVRLIDRLLDLLDADPDYLVYTLDGQMSVLDDYLEARPSQRTRLEAACRSGRVRVGPWFVLADEFLVSPESLIRNLRLGFAMGESYGGVMRIGYVPDGFGHIAQLPQILRGFGIDNAFFWRGMGTEGDQLGTEFTWQSPNGQGVTAILMPWGYHNVSNLGYAIHWGDTSMMAFDSTLAQDKITRAIERLLPMVNTPALLLMNGIDHAEAEPSIPTVIAARRDDVHIVQGTLHDHLMAVRASGVPLKSFTGEFRWGRYSEILQGVYSTRIHLKQANHRAEVMLERAAEPSVAFAWLAQSGAGVKSSDGTSDLLALAWRWLLLNHPHDDMYGCGIDAVHAEMPYRFSQSDQIASCLIRDAVRELAVQIDMTAQSGMPILLLNPLGQERNDSADITLDFDFDDATADAFHIIDAQGNAVLHQIISDEQALWMEVLKPNRKRRVRVLLQTPRGVPSCGYQTVFVQPGNRDVPSSLRVGGLTMENPWHTVTLASDGGITVTDHDSGRTYTGLHHFADVADAGDSYSHCPLPGDVAISTHEGEAIIAVTERGPVRATMRVTRTLSVPASLTVDRGERTPETVVMTFISDISLYAGQPGVFITTQVENLAHDHKLMALFPTGIQTDKAFVDASFMVSERDLHLPESVGWVEDPTPLMHQRSFTDLNADNAGLAILNRGLPSVEVDEDGTIALTLLRGVGWLSRDDLWNRRIAAGPMVTAPGAQCPGKYTFEYAILPHAGGWQVVTPVAGAYTAPIFGGRADTHTGLELREMNITRDDPQKITPLHWRRDGHLPPEHSWVSVEHRSLMLSACLKEGDALIVRIVNMARDVVHSPITFGFAVQQVERVNLLHEAQANLEVTANTIQITANPAEIITLQVVPHAAR